MSFVVGEHTRLAVVADAVTEIVDVGSLTALPRAPDHVVGIAQVRARPVPVVDLARFFGLPCSQPDDAARFVLVQTESMEVAFVGRNIVVHSVIHPTVAKDGIAYGDRIRPHVRAEIETSRGLAVLLDLSGVLDAARVRH